VEKVQPGEATVGKKPTKERREKRMRGRQKRGKGTGNHPSRAHTGKAVNQDANGEGNRKKKQTQKEESVGPQSCCQRRAGEP